MCGIAGLLNFSRNKVDIGMLGEIAIELSHRGPDDTDFVQFDHASFVHTRLSIHDLTTAGHQPMRSFNGRWIIVYNGEIYNYMDLRNQLTQLYDVKFNSHSDTEVLVNSIAIWGGVQRP